MNQDLLQSPQTSAIASDRVIRITDGQVSRIQSRSELDIQVGTIDHKEE